MAATRLSFASDYQEGAVPQIIQRLVETNLERTAGYGFDHYSESAREKIRAACQAPDAEVYFLVGGTQANATCIDALLARYQGVVAADTGHVSVHEAGAIEFGGHKVLTIPGTDGKLSADAVERYCATWEADANRDHMVMPGMVYLSQPTEYGTLYSLAELSAIREVCTRHDLRLYVDGARLAYALACPANDVTLLDLARLCDVFYIGGTKCGALFGEAVVVPRPGTIPHFFTIIKQHGALLAKGRITGLQFDALFTDDLYLHLGETAVHGADRIRDALRAGGVPLLIDSPTNQVFPIVANDDLDRLGSVLDYGFWEQVDDEHTAIRLATSWATTDEDVDALLDMLSACGMV